MKRTFLENISERKQLSTVVSYKLPMVFDLHNCIAASLHLHS